jgi:hypothetical protein
MSSLSRTPNMVSSLPIMLHDPKNGRLRNTKASTQSSRLKLRETRFIMTKTCDFLQIASKTIQIMIQFNQNCSIVTNLCTITEFISGALDDRRQVDMVYTDFSSAFDSIAS